MTISLFDLNQFTHGEVAYDPMIIPPTVAEAGVVLTRLVDGPPGILDTVCKAGVTSASRFVCLFVLQKKTAKEVNK
jgi:hypothetical protein